MEREGSGKHHQPRVPLRLEVNFAVHGKEVGIGLAHKQTEVISVGPYQDHHLKLKPQFEARLNSWGDGDEITAACLELGFVQYERRAMAWRAV